MLQFSDSTRNIISGDDFVGRMRGVHRVLRTNPPREINLRFFSFFLFFSFLSPRLGFSQMNRKRMSLTDVLLRNSNSEIAIV